MSEMVFTCRECRTVTRVVTPPGVPIIPQGSLFVRGDVGHGGDVNHTNHIACPVCRNLFTSDEIQRVGRTS